MRKLYVTQNRFREIVIYSRGIHTSDSSRKSTNATFSDLYAVDVIK